MEEHSPSKRIAAGSSPAVPTITAMNRMYILIGPNCPDDIAPLMAAHAALACYREFHYVLEMQDWVENSFRKCVCRVNAKEWERARHTLDHVMLDEPSLA